MICISATLMLACFAAGAEKIPITVGSKAFTESVILGEVAKLLAEHQGHPAGHKGQLGGTAILWQALLKGEIDLYPEYTGTIVTEILKGKEGKSFEEMSAALKTQGISATPPLGFNNTYALGMLAERAEEENIARISDLQKHPAFRFGFTNEFMSRQEGWPTLQQRYQLPQQNVRGLQQQLAYRALAEGAIDVMDVYSTDADIKTAGLRVLEDDLRHFPEYEAVYLYRSELKETAPDFVAALRKLAGAISAEEMIALNESVTTKKSSEAQAAADFLKQENGIAITVTAESRAGRIWKYTWQHLYLVVVSLAAAIAVAVPLGVVAAKLPKLGQFILATAEIIQTIPGLALLVLLIPPISAIGLNAVGPAPAIVALFLYSLLPIIRNTYTGMHDVPHALRESASVLGLDPRAKLWLVELPMASRMILAGIKTTAAINVGYAALGGLIGAGGYGEPIMTGLRLSDTSLMLEGAIPAALMALAAKGLFEICERTLVPAGLRLSGN